MDLAVWRRVQAVNVESALLLAQAAVSTVLVSRAGPVAGGVGRAARALGTANAFHAAYWVLVAFAALGALTAAIAFPWRATRKTEPAPRRGVGSVPASG